MPAVNLQALIAKLAPDLVTNEPSEDDVTEHLVAIYQARAKATNPKRTPMGEYIVPPGGKPLTSLGDHMPAPSDYCPKVDLTKPAAPQFSVAGRQKAAKPDYYASPADNQTNKPMVWSDKGITLKEKGRTRPYDVRDCAHVNDSVGPARYRVQHNNVGSSGPRCSVASRHRQGVNAGIPNSKVQPVDTHGVDTPGPTYRPSSNYWGRGPKKSFGIQWKNSLHAGPGPAEYMVLDSPGGPAYSMSKRLPPPLSWRQSVHTDSPGPGSYDLGTTVGKAQAKSISGRHDVTPKAFVPAPNCYTLPGTMMNVPTAALTCRPFEQNEGPHPGPTQYTITGADLPKAPTFSCGKHTKPGFPDSLNYTPIDHEATPGPGQYEAKRNNISSNDNPKFSMGKKGRTPKNEVPGPNHYHLKSESRQQTKCAPKFSMGRQLHKLDKHVSPGPAAYNPKPTTHGNAGYSMTMRPKMSTSMSNPAANAYHLQDNQNNKGVTAGPKVVFKSRCSPYVYSGFHNVNMIRG